VLQLDRVDVHRQEPFGARERQTHGGRKLGFDEVTALLDDLRELEQHAARIHASGVELEILSG
jgi:hypothetical protein